MARPVVVLEAEPSADDLPKAGLAVGEASAVDDDSGVPAAMESSDAATAAANAHTRFDDVWMQVWEEVRPLRRGADVVVHLGGQVFPSAALSPADLSTLRARETSLRGEVLPSVLATPRCRRDRKTPQLPHTPPCPPSRPHT